MREESQTAHTASFLYWSLEKRWVILLLENCHEFKFGTQKLCRNKLVIWKVNEQENKVESALRPTSSVTRLAREDLKEEKRRHQKCSSRKKSSRQRKKKKSDIYFLSYKVGFNQTGGWKPWEQHVFPPLRTITAVDINYSHTFDSNLLTQTTEAVLVDTQFWGPHPASPAPQHPLWSLFLAGVFPCVPLCTPFPPPDVADPAERVWVPTVLLWPVCLCRFSRCFPLFYGQWIWKCFPRHQKACPWESWKPSSLPHQNGLLPPD